MPAAPFLSQALASIKYYDYDYDDDDDYYYYYYYYDDYYGVTARTLP